MPVPESTSLLENEEEDPILVLKWVTEELEAAIGMARDVGLHELAERMTLALENAQEELRKVTAKPS